MAIDERKSLSDDDIATVSVRQAIRPGAQRPTTAQKDADQGDVDGTDTGDVDGTDTGDVDGTDTGGGGDADGGDRGDATDRGDQTRDGAAQAWMQHLQAALARRLAPG